MFQDGQAQLVAEIKKMFAAVRYHLYSYFFCSTPITVHGTVRYLSGPHWWYFFYGGIRYQMRKVAYRCRYSSLVRYSQMWPIKVYHVIDIQWFLFQIVNSLQYTMGTGNCTETLYFKFNMTGFWIFWNRIFLEMKSRFLISFPPDSFVLSTWYCDLDSHI